MPVLINLLLVVSEGFLQGFDLYRHCLCFCRDCILHFLEEISKVVVWLCWVHVAGVPFFMVWALVECSIAVDQELDPDLDYDKSCHHQ